MTFAENLQIALGSIAANKMRAVITALIISIGIMALVGILTAIDGIKSSINSSFSNVGANTFNIKNRSSSIQFGTKGKAPKKYQNITRQDAYRFKEEYQYPSTTSVSVNASFASTVKFGAIKTEPNVMVMGGDENYLKVAGYDLKSGRNFGSNEIQGASNVAIIGKEIADKLFKKKQPLGESIYVGSAKYRVVGVLSEKGSAMGFGGDRIVVVPIENARQVFARPNMSYVITVAVTDVPELEAAVAEAEAVFRRVRKLPASSANNFEIMKADNIAKEIIGMLSYATIAATVIGFITLLGAAVGLMNIMLVSVTERTREIGIRKSIGATASVIRRQFLLEAIAICQIGGIGGVILGIAIGNAVSLLLNGGFIIPWLWMIAGLVLCLCVGLASGLYPAIKASRLDPIEALRYE
ncbi:MAG: ABC transporter permease [Bacteroidia bacterium]|jgi:putative ABC transport system permease protein|nr:ABC transporter permease [Bacteroidia bacterium]